MSWNAVKAAFPSPCASPTEKLVLLCLAFFESPDTGLCCPSIPTIAKHCNLSERSVINALGRLKSAGMVSWAKLKGRNGEYNSYTLHPCISFTPETPSPLKQTALTHENDGKRPLKQLHTNRILTGLNRKTSAKPPQQIDPELLEAMR